MRNISKAWFFLIFSVFVTASCHKELAEFDGQEIVQEEEGIVLNLKTNDMTPATRAGKDGTRPGNDDGAFNENRITTVDVFFFADDADDDTPSLWNKAFSLNGTTLHIPVTLADLTTIFGSPTNGSTADVVAVANYDGTPFEHSSRHYSRNEINAMPLKRADWSKLPQDYFVMLSDKTTVTLEDAASSTPAKQTVNLRRRAAKVTFRLTVADAIAAENYTYKSDGTVEKSIEVWEPLVDKMTVYTQYMMKDGVLGGEPTLSPVSIDSPMLYTGVDNPYMLVKTSDYISRNRHVLREDEQGNYIYNEETKEYEYDVMDVDVPLYETRFTEHGTDADGHSTSYPSENLGPFYTYPITWNPGEQTEPFIKLIIPWKSGKDERVKYYYYKIPFSEPELVANNWYEVTLDVQILGGEEELPVPLEANYHVVDWITGSTTSASVVSARYLSVPTKYFTMYNTEELEIPMLSSHPCEIVNVTVTKPKYGRSTYSNPTVNFTNATTSDGKLVLSSLEEIDLEHTLSNEMGPSLDCAPYTITFRVRQLDDTDYYADITIVQYPAIYIEKTAGGNAFVDGYYSLVSGGKPDQNAVSRTTSGFAHYYHYGYFQVDNGRRVTPYGNLSGVQGDNQANQNYNGAVTVPTSETENTRIHVTAFTDGSSTYTYDGDEKAYIIGDPRIPFSQSIAITDKTITPYLTPGGSNNATTAWTADQLSKLMVGTDDENIIAPAFMFASEWGRQGNQESSFETVAKRCATYQEAGYPAGRWRLPTEAEVAFCANLQANNYIGTLFGSGRYWISNGTAVSVSGGGVTSQTTGNSTRCVYDIWYWGEDPVVNPTYRYAVMP